MSVWLPWKLQLYGNVTRIHVSLFKELFWVFFCLACLKPHDWGILQYSCYRWLQHNLFYNQREAWKVTDLQIREKSVVAVLRLVTYFFSEENMGQILPSHLWDCTAGWIVEGLSLLTPHSSPSTEVGESPFHATAPFTLVSQCPTPNSRSCLMKFSLYLSSSPVLCLPL